MQKFWYRLWFQPIDARQYAWVRMAMAYMAAVYLAQLLPFADQHFSSSGWLASQRVLTVLNWGSWSLFRLDFGDLSIAYTLCIFWLGILAALAMLLGWQTRLATFITWLVLVSLWNVNPLLLDGDDALIKVMCFYLLFCPAGLCWSVDARNTANTLITVPVGALRLIQFQLALVYFVSGWVKFHSTEWLDGRIFAYVLSHPHYARFDLSTYIDYTAWANMFRAMSGLIRWWELLFPFLILHPLSRRVALGLGVIFHVGLGLAMNLRWFPLLMLVLYPALLSRSEFSALINYGQRLYSGLLSWFIKPAHRL